MLKIITWNVNSVAMRLPRLLALLERSAPDVLCLQELKGLEEAFPFEALRELGYHAAVFGQKAFNGVALVSRAPATDVVRGFGDGVDDAQSRFISGRFGDTTVISVYVPNGQSVGGEKYFYKLNWLARLKRYLEQAHRSGDQTVIGGDFNIAPTPLDTHDPSLWEGKILCSDRERAAYNAILTLGFVDGYRQLHPRETQFTWWDYRMLGFPKNLGLRIDLLLASEALKGRIKACYVDRDERKGDKPSDHAPLVLELA